MKRTPIVLGLLSVAVLPALAAGAAETSQGLNCVDAHASVQCLGANQMPVLLTTPTATARAALDAYLAQSDDGLDRDGFSVGARAGYQLAETGRNLYPADGPAEAQTGWRFDAVSEFRSLWGGTSRDGSFKLAQAVTSEQLDKALADHLAQRDFWNKAHLAGDNAPVGVPQQNLEAALAALLKERASWGTSPSKSVADFDQDQRGWKLSDMLGLRKLWGGESTADSVSDSGADAAPAATPEEVDRALKALLAQREQWSRGEGQAVAGAAATPRASANAGAAAATADDEAVTTDVSQAELQAALAALLAERARWGTAPWDSPASSRIAEATEKISPAGSAKAGKAPLSTKGPAADELATGDLATGDLEILLRQRAAWGTGPEARVVEAPLAAGAVFPLPKQERRQTAQSAAEPIIHAAEITPVAVLNPVPAAEIDAALASLFKQREAWEADRGPTGSASEGAVPGDAVVSDAVASVAQSDAPSDAQSGAEVAGLAALATSSLDELLKQRAMWGAGIEGAAVVPPLAAGAVFPLPQAPIRPVAQAAAEPIIHAAEITPVPELTTVAPDVLTSSLATLLEERASWGTEPTIGDGTHPYASLPTASLAELLAERAKWGAGGAGSPVEAPLAAGAVVPLPKQEATAAVEKPADPIVHAAEITPAAKLAEADPAEIAKALKRVLAERAAAGKAPGKATKVAAPSEEPRTVAAPTVANSSNDALSALLQERATWGKAPTKLPERKDGGAVRDAAAVSPVPAGGSGASAGYPALSTKSLAQLLEQRAEWVGKPDGGIADARAGGAGAVRTEAKSVLKPAPTQTGAIAPGEGAACTGELSSIASAGGISFGPSSAAIDTASRAVLKQIGELARSCPGVKFRIEGHTDASGTAGKNQVLSEARARSVMNYLVAFGIDKSRLTAVGFGETKPIADNDSAQNRAKNRRIEFVPVIE